MMDAVDMSTRLRALRSPRLTGRRSTIEALRRAATRPAAPAPRLSGVAMCCAALYGRHLNSRSAVLPDGWEGQLRAPLPFGPDRVRFIRSPGDSRCELGGAVVRGTNSRTAPPVLVVPRDVFRSLMDGRQ